MNPDVIAWKWCRLLDIAPEITEAPPAFYDIGEGDLLTSQNHRLLVGASAHINAAPKNVYDIIADYRKGHPSIVPDAFSDMTVERGGVGDGTIIRFKMRVFGRTQAFRAAVTEPEPGRILVETDLDSNGAITTFTVNTGAAPGTSEVTITTELPVKGGPLGALQRFVTTRFLRPLYLKELALLAACAREKTDQACGS